MMGTGKKNNRHTRHKRTGAHRTDHAVVTNMLKTNKSYRKLPERLAVADAWEWRTTTNREMGMSAVEMGGGLTGVDGTITLMFDRISGRFAAHMIVID